MLSVKIWHKKLTTEAKTQTFMHSLSDNQVTMITRKQVSYIYKESLFVPVWANRTKFGTGQFSRWCEPIPP